MSVEAPEALRVEIERIQTSGTLGRARLRRLFDYLASCSLADTTPKEISIALDVFGKDAGFDVSQDALVRVYIHKLRRTLDNFYLQAGVPGSPSLYVPRGEYRLTLKPASTAASAGDEMDGMVAPTAAETPKPPTRRPAIRYFVTAACVLLMMIAAVVWLRNPAGILEQVRGDPIWAPFVKDTRPIVIVVGDYYLVGETDDSMEVTRLIREYGVNSKGDLDDFLKLHPEFADRYMDVGLRYLPTGVAFALRDISPVLAVEGRSVSVTTMSDLTPNMLKNNDIVYLGYLSGLGLMRQLAFAGSRFTIGESYDELVDKKTKRSYISQSPSQSAKALQQSPNDSTYRDYGWVASLRGPDGNWIMIVSGTRDDGVREAAKALTTPARLKELHNQKQRPAGHPFEGLYEVRALNGVNLSSKLLLLDSRP